MEEKTLLSFCRSSFKQSLIFFLAPYDTAEVYSFGKHIRKYGHYPSFLPLCIYTDHGAGRMNHPYEHELRADAPCQFYHSPESVAEWKKVSKKPCYVLYSPFVFYRRKNKIERAADAKGTIAFPAHTTPEIDDISDAEIYIKQLLELPETFQPVSACLHVTDINKGLHKLFLKYKIPVYTAGNAGDYRFAERFYNILRNFAFSTSNMVGSYAYYSVEMGIPFSIYGNKQVFINTGDPNITLGEWDPYTESQSYRTMFDAFLGLHTKITKEQRDLVEVDLGLRDGISRLKMTYVLYFSLFRWATSAAAITYASDRVRKMFQRIFT